MAKRTAVAQAEDAISEAVPHLIRLPERKAWIDYDEEADVLYISLKRPQKATDTKLLADKGILLRYRDKDLVGVTVLDASKPRKKTQGKNSRRSF
ncbi:MAG: DUF2283 domain-containing protein [Deltaproteobacteria bacterium]|nr:DUF2283 domain-containing protein [Deltaproteobacteria bacterium]